MARPIESTPTLEGVDAENFFRELERPRSKEEVELRKRVFAEADSVFKRLGKHIIGKMLGNTLAF